VRCVYIFQGLQGAQFVQCDIFDSAALATALDGENSTHLPFSHTHAPHCILAAGPKRRALS